MCVVGVGAGVGGGGWWEGGGGYEAHFREIGDGRPLNHTHGRTLFRLSSPI